MGRRHSHRSDRIFGLDLMRAMAIVMVLFGHLTWIMPQEFRTVNMLMSLLGFWGVEVFFVLSGFLIGKILYRQFTEHEFNFNAVREFLKRRWLRTLPNYFLILCVNIFIALAVIDYKIDGLWRYFFFLQNFNTQMPVFFPESWSLTIEEFAYVILPIVLFSGVSIIGKSDKKKLFFQLVLLVYLIFIGTKISYTFTTDYRDLAQWNLHLKGVTLYRVDAICTGVIAAWIALNYRDFWYKTRWLAAFSGVVLALFLVFGASFFGIGIDKHYFFWNVIFLPVLSIAIGAMLPLLSSWKTEPYGIGRPITYVSLISYSVYLLHYGVVMQLLHNFFLTELGWKLSALVYFAITFLMSGLLYQYFEKPIMDLREKRPK